MIKIGVLLDENPDKIYLEQLKKTVPFEFSGLLMVNGARLDPSDHFTGLRICRSIEDLTVQSDALIFLLGSPPDPETIIYALKNFKHLFFSSPVLLPDRRISEIKKLAEEARVIIHIGNPARHHPSFLKVRAYISKPVYIEFRKTGLPLLSGQEAIKASLISDIEMSLSLLKGQPRKIQTQSTLSRGPDQSVLFARIEFDNGSSASFTYVPLRGEETHLMNVYQPHEHFYVDFIQNRVSRAFKKRSGEYSGTSRGGLIPVETDIREMQPADNKSDEIMLFYGELHEAHSIPESFEESFSAHALALQILQRIHG